MNLRVPYQIALELFNTSKNWTLAITTFKGIYPRSLGNLEQLILFDLSHNNLKGDITLHISKFEQLTDIRFSSNKFSGEIPDTFGKCLQLETLLMDQNYLIGNIPTSFESLQFLKTLNLSHNNLSGTIPTILKIFHFSISWIFHTIISKEKYQSVEYLQMQQLFHTMATGGSAEERWISICLHALQFLG